MDELKQQADNVAKLSAERLSILEQTLPLAAHFQEIHDDLLKWYAEVEPAIMENQDVMAINADQIKAQQDTVKVCQ